MPRQTWGVRCRAHRTSDGQPCAAWSVRGAYVCVKHGGAAPQVRAKAEYRMVMAGIWNQAERRLVKRLRALGSGSGIAWPP